MLTRLLKIFLYSILVLIFFWGGLILFGPTVLKFSANKYYGEKINLIGLKISPRLKIYASRIEFNNLTLPNFGLQSGFVRAASFSFKNFSDGKLSFELITGPIEVDGLAALSSSSTLISIEEFYTSNEVGLELIIDQVDIINTISAERFSGQGFLNLKSRELRQIQFSRRRYIVIFMKKFIFTRYREQVLNLI